MAPDPEQQDKPVSLEICDVKHEAVEKEIDRVDIRTESIFTKIDNINKAFSGDTEKAGIFEILRILNHKIKKTELNEKKMTKILAFQDKCKKIAKTIKWAIIIVLALWLLSVGGSAIGMRWPVVVQNKVRQVTREILFVPEKELTEEQKIKTIVKQMLKEQQKEEEDK